MPFSMITFRLKKTGGCHPEHSEGSEAMMGEILHCVQNDQPRVYFCHFALADWWSGQTGD
jgi:hypothetical protein